MDSRFRGNDDAGDGCPEYRHSRESGNPPPAFALVSESRARAVASRASAPRCLAAPILRRCERTALSRHVVGATLVVALAWPQGPPLRRDSFTPSQARAFPGHLATRNAKHQGTRHELFPPHRAWGVGQICGDKGCSQQVSVTTRQDLFSLWSPQALQGSVSDTTTYGRMGTKVGGEPLVARYPRFQQLKRRSDELGWQPFAVNFKDCSTDGILTETGERGND